MTTVKINFNDLRDAAKQSRNAAKEMESYADKLPGSVNNPLSSLTGGSSSYTSTAASLASQKQSQLRNRATAYRNLATQAENFATYAQEVDKNIGRQIRGVADRRAEGLEWWQKVGYAIFKSWNHQFGATEAGAIAGNVANAYSWLRAKHDEYVRRVYDWFAHGKGKYVLNIALAGIGIITGIIGTILLFPVSGVIAIALAAVTIFATVVAVVDGVAKIKANFDALGASDTEPGLARYYGTVSDLSDYEKKYSTDSRKQAFASGFDTAGKIAGAISFFGNFGMTRAADGTRVVRFDRDTVIGNIGGKFGFKFDKDLNHYVFNPKTLLGLGGKPFMENNPAKWFTVAERADGFFTPLENMLKVFNAATTCNGQWDGYRDVKNASGAVASLFPGLKGYDKLIGYGHNLKLW